MAFLKINDVEYRTDTLDLREQLHVARRLHPIVGAIKESFMRGSIFLLKFGQKKEADPDATEKPEEVTLKFEEFLNEIDAIEPFTTALGKMSDEDTDYIMSKCLAKSYRINRNPATGEVVGLHPVVDANGRMMYDDIKLDTALQLVWSVASESLGNFTSVNRLFQQTG
jgi:hypothetical protein